MKDLYRLYDMEYDILDELHILTIIYPTVGETDQAHEEHIRTLNVALTDLRMAIAEKEKELVTA